MVDLGVTTHAAGAACSDASHSRSASDLTVTVRAAHEGAFDDYKRFCESAAHAPAQNPIWIRAWLDTVNRDGIIAFIEHNRETVAALALEVVRQGPFRVARFMGGNHANGNFVAARQSMDPLTPSDGAQLADAIRKARPDVDIVILERQNPFQDAVENPFTRLRTTQSPNVSLAVDLTGGFEATLSRRNGKRKRKKFNQHLRRFEEVGGYRFVVAMTHDEVQRLASEFFVMKAARFRTKGIQDVFEPREIQHFFRQLFVHALAEDAPPFALHGLEVNGELLSVAGLSLQEHSVVCEFGGVRDHLHGVSPGFVLDYARIESACGEGKKLFDFSVGDEEYKRSWCDVETWQFDVLMPLTVKGRVAFAYATSRARMVGFLKRNSALWALAKRLRKIGAGTRPPLNG